jgi:uncharacterized delta-60 repeat protein
VRGMKSKSLGVLAGATAAALLVAGGSALGNQGDLDPSFSGDGTLVFNVDHGAVNGVAVDKKGRTVLAGYVDPPGPDAGDVAVERLLPDGSPDPSFSGDGFATVDASGSGGTDRAEAVAIDTLNQVVVAGETSGPTDSVIALFTEAGLPDAGFGGVDGMFKQDLGSGADDLLTDVALDSTGRPVAAGAVGNAGSRNFLVVQLTNTGLADTSFGGGDGFEGVNVNSVASNDFARGLALDDQGRIVLAGSTQLAGFDDNFAAVRFSKDGLLDTTYGNPVTAGRMIVQMASQNGSEDADLAEDIVAVPGDKVVLAGEAEQAGLGFEFALLRLDANGNPDTTFSGDGKVYPSFGSNEDESLGAITRDPDKKLVVAGVSRAPGGADRQFALARLTAKGELDKSFSGDGLTTTDVGPGDDTANGVAIDPVTRRIVAAGYNGTQGDPDLAAARYEAVSRCAGQIPTIVGTDDSDELHGTKKKDVITGEGGGDTIKAAKGADLVCGRGGKDRIVGGPGNDTLYGDNGPDNILAGKGKDKAFGGKGKDKLKGGPGKDKLKGGPGHDLIIK